MRDQEKQRAARARWLERNREKAKAAKRAWCACNRERVNATARALRARARAELSDRYVVGILTDRCDMRAADVTPELIALKRQALQIVRMRRLIVGVIDATRECVRQDARPFMTEEQRRHADAERFRARYAKDPGKEVDRVRRYKKRKREEAKSSGREVGPLESKE